MIPASTPIIIAAPTAIAAMAPPHNEVVCVAATAGVVATAAPAVVKELIELLDVMIGLDDEVAVALLPPKGVGPPCVGDVRTVLS